MNKGVQYKKIKTLMAVMVVFTMVFSLTVCGSTNSDVHSGTQTTEAHTASEDNLAESGTWLDGERFIGIIPACLLGIVSPLCMYGTIPIAASFRKQGMREDWLAAFMMDHEPGGS